MLVVVVSRSLLVKKPGFVSASTSASISKLFTVPSQLVSPARRIGPAGNVATQVVSVSVTHPQMRGVHLTGYGWNATVLRNPVLVFARQHRINTIELDVKEEDGYVDFDTSVRLAHQIHAVRVLYDPHTVIPLLHKMGVRVVGRIVCFRDPKLAVWAWSHHHRDWDVQAPGGKAPYKSATV